MANENASTSNNETPRVNNNKKSCCSSLNNFLERIIPVDEQTYHYVLPVCGFALSCFSFGMFVVCIGLRGRAVANIFGYGYMSLAGACAVGLHYAFSKKDRRQFFYWIVLKSIDIIFTLIAFLLELFRNGTYLDFLIFTAFIAVGNFFLLIHIIRKSKVRKTLTRTESVYDIQSTEIYSNVTVY